MTFRDIRVAAIISLAALLLAACGVSGGEQSDGDTMVKDELLDGTVHAPDFPAGVEWLNTDKPLSMAGLEGKIVLLDFWTFCCINCIHVIPDLKRLEEKYAEELVVIGVHSAKFTNEKGTESIRQAILRYEIEHPVVNDKDFIVWSQFGARAWPTLVLINPNGRIIGSHSGEGAYDVFDPIIQSAVDYFDAKGELNRGVIEYALEKSNKPNTLLSYPGKVKADANGKRLFITDSNNNRILIVSPDGEILDVIGGGTMGREDGSFETAQFNHPQGVSIAGDTLYIADTENHLIRAVDLKSREVTTILGTGSQARSYNQPGYGRSVALNSPWDVLVHDGIIYIAMAGSHQLWSTDLKTLKAEPYAGSAREARIDGPLLQAALAQPSGLTTDGKKIYFTDSETSSIRSADIDRGGNVTTIVGEDLFEYGDIDGKGSEVRLQHPLGVVYHDGMLYIADTYNSKIKVIDPEKKTSKTYAGTGMHGLVDGKASDAQFSEPGGITVLGGKLYISDTNNHLIRVVDLTTGDVSTLPLTGLEKLHPDNMDTFSGRMIELPSQKVKPGSGRIVFDVNLPDGHKFAEGAPLFVDIRTSDSSIVTIGDRPSEVTFPYEIEYDARNGMTEVQIDVVVYFCPDKSSLCMFDNIRVNVPIEVNDSGKNTIAVTVDAQTTE